MSKTKVQEMRKLTLKKHSPVYRFFNKMLQNPYVLVGPSVIMDLWLTIIPVLFCVYVSFFKWDLVANTMKFVGLKNYRYIFHDEMFLKALRNTVIFMLVCVFIGLILKILVGLFLNKNTKAHNLVQTTIFTPTIISSVAIAMVFMYLMRPDGGVFNAIIQALGGKPIGWYKEQSTALFSVLLMTLWINLGYGVLIIISGLRSIPQYVYEAAKLDRSGRVRTLCRITMPLLSPTIFYILVTSTIGAFTSFDTVKLMTEGGPNNATITIALYIYNQGFAFMHYGRAMAASVVLLIIAGSLSAVNFIVAGKKVHYQ